MKRVSIGSTRGRDSQLRAQQAGKPLQWCRAWHVLETNSRPVCLKLGEQSGGVAGGEAAGDAGTSRAALCWPQSGV